MENTDQLYRRYLEHPVICTDSRSILPGSLFFALKGESFDGNRFAETALEKGSAYAIVDDKNVMKDDRYILVGNVLEALQQLASCHREHLDIPVLAITGTNGKTTTKELTHAVLSKKFNTVATIGNLNNHIGVPLTILSATPGTEFLIVEMGANHPGEIRFLCELARPEFGLITNIGKAHLEGFGGFEGVIRTKTELYRHLHNNNGMAFVNADDPLLMEKARELKKSTYGSVENDDFRGRIKDEGPFVTVEIGYGGTVEIRSRLFGSYNAGNILAAAAIGHYFGVNGKEIKDAIENYIPSNNRSQVMQKGSNLLVLDAYNANPSSMRAAIETFAATAYENKVAILGDMLELGEESVKEHEEVLRILEESNILSAYLVGPVFTEVCRNRSWICFQDSDLAKLWFEHHKIENATILVKGSRGIKLEKIVEVL
jgi:UDP-N-acetylmuramoyl-tripeptide--D-alanyl-D-alanine ligase